MHVRFSCSYIVMRAVELCQSRSMWETRIEGSFVSTLHAATSIWKPCSRIYTDPCGSRRDAHAPPALPWTPSAPVGVGGVGGTHLLPEDPLREALGGLPQPQRERWPRQPSQPSWELRLHAPDVPCKAWWCHGAGQSSGEDTVQSYALRRAAQQRSYLSRVDVGSPRSPEHTICQEAERVRGR